MNLRRGANEEGPRYDASYHRYQNIFEARGASLAGIGGVSMCPLAEVLLGMGLIVQGSDMTESDTVCQLHRASTWPSATRRRT